MDDLLQTLDEMLIPSVKPVGWQLTELKIDDFPATQIKKEGKALLCQFDVENLELFPIFNKSLKKLCEKCDYVIFYPSEDTLYVFLCELKSNKTSGAVSQLTATKFLTQYIVQMACRHLGKTHYDIKYRGLIFSKNSNNQRFTTNPKNDEQWETEKSSQLKYRHLKIGDPCRLETQCR